MYSSLVQLWCCWCRYG